MVLGLLAPPAIAATTAEIPCKQSTAPTLSVEFDELVSATVSHSASATAESSDAEHSQGFLKPRAKAAIRDAFEDSEAVSVSSANIDLSDATLRSPIAGKSIDSDVTEDDDEDAGADSGMNTKLPGVSDDDSLRYKKQMYRRDI